MWFLWRHVAFLSEADFGIINFNWNFALGVAFFPLFLCLIFWRSGLGNANFFGLGNFRCSLFMNLIVYF